MKKALAAYAFSAVAFLAIDAVWLSTMGDVLYRPILGDLLAPTFRIEPAVAFYFIYIGGITLLATLPALREASWRKAAINGAILGFVAYATYDLTNQATLRTWSTMITVIDIAWGTFLTCSAAIAGYFGSRLLVK